MTKERKKNVKLFENKILKKFKKNKNIPQRDRNCGACLRLLGHLPTTPLTDRDSGN